MKYTTFTLNKLSATLFLKLYSLHYMIYMDTPVFGLQILKHVRRFSECWQPSHGTLYPVLSELLKDGLIEVSHYEEVKVDGVEQRKKFYVITEWGIVYYNERKEEFIKNLTSSAKFYNSVVYELNYKKD